MSKKNYIFAIALILILNIAPFCYYLVKKTAWEQEKKNIELTAAGWQKKYEQILPQLQEFKTQLQKNESWLNELNEAKAKNESWLNETKTKNESLSQEILVLQKEKTVLTQEIKRLREPEYLTDIIRDYTRLKVEVKESREKINTRDNTIASLIKEKETLEAHLGEEKYLAGQMTDALADERKKGHSLTMEAVQQSSIIEQMETKVSNMERSQTALQEKINGLEEIVIEKDKEIRELEENLTSAYRQNKLLENTLTQTREEKELLEEELAATRRLYAEARITRETLEKQLGSITKENEMLSAKLSKTGQKVTALDEKLQKMELALSDKALEKGELAEQYKRLAQEKIELQETLGQKEKDTSLKLALTKTITVPRDTGIKGKILAISEKYKFIIIDIGEEDGVKIGDKFSIYRGDKTVGEVEVTRIRSTSSFGNITSLAEGIAVTTTDTVR